MIRVCLADDQALIRSGLKALLHLLGGVEVIAEAGDGEQAVEAVLASNPEVLLLDVRMPKLNGIEVVETLARQGKLPPTLLLTTFEDDNALIQGVKAGARGYLLKGASPETLMEGWREVSGVLATALDGASEDMVSQVSTQGPPSADGKISGVINFLAIHETYHVGQASYLRGWMGHKGLMG